MSEINASRVPEGNESSHFDNEDISPVPSETMDQVQRSTRKRPSIPRKPMPPRSFVWNHFNRLEENKDKCKCRHCGQQYECKTGVHGTSNLRTHLKKCKEYLSYEESQTVLANDPIAEGNEEEGGNVVVNRGFSQEACRRATVKMIVLDELPFSHVENVGFRHFCSVSCPRYVVPSRRTITKDIFNMFLEEKTMLKSLLCDNKQRVSLTTDIWTSITTASYMVITAHFIDKDWHLHRRIISFNTVPDHKGDTIGKQLEKCLIDWGLERVFTITMDNASANENAVRYLNNKLKTWKDDSLIMDGAYLHVRCCAHILNLIVGDGLAELDESVVGIRNAVKYVRSSTARMQAFKICVEQEKINFKGSVILDCVTRWNSTFTMLTIALKFKTAFDRMANEDKLYEAYFHESDSGTKMKRVGPPVNHDWDSARRMVKILRIFYDATLSFSSSLNVTSNLCYNEICKIESTLASLSLSSDSHLSSMAYKMKDKFDKYWEGTSKINKLLIVATVLDPRGKMNFATHCFEKLYGRDSLKCVEMKGIVKDVLQKLYGLYSARCASASGSASANASASVSGLNFVDLDTMDEDDIEDPFAEYSKIVADTRENIELSNELDLYLMEPVEYPASNRLGLKFDILLWWRVNSSKYPILAEITRDVLAIPVSTVASESAFSTGGRTVDEYRSSLAPDMVEALILTQNWLRSKLFVDATTNLNILIEENEFIDA